MAATHHPPRYIVFKSTGERYVIGLPNRDTNSAGLGTEATPGLLLEPSICDAEARRDGHGTATGAADEMARAASPE